MNPVFNFVKNNIKTIAAIGLAAACIIAGKNSGGSISYTLNDIFGEGNKRSSSNPLVTTSNPVEEAVSAIYKSAKDASWSSDKIAAAKKIQKLMKKDGVTDETKSFAIKLLSDIKRTMTWSSDKTVIDNIICDILGD